MAEGIFYTLLIALLWTGLFVGTLAVLRRFWMWLFGVDEIIAELRALRAALGDVQALPRRESPSSMAPAPMGNRPPSSTWPD